MENINYEDMVRTLAKSGEVIASELTGEDCHLLHMAVGLSGEVAELSLALINVDLENALEELGDIEFYTEGMLQTLRLYNVVADNFEVPSKVCPLPDSFMYLVAEAGEILDLIKKRAIYRKPLDVASVMTSIAKFRSILQGIYDGVGYTVEQAKEANMKKLGKRYEGLKYSDTAAQDRADKQA